MDLLSIKHKTLIRRFVCNTGKCIMLMTPENWVRKILCTEDTRTEDAQHRRYWALKLVHWRYYWKTGTCNAPIEISYALSTLCGTLFIMPCAPCLVHALFI